MEISNTTTTIGILTAPRPRIIACVFLCLVMAMAVGGCAKQSASDALFWAITRNDIPAIEAYIRENGDVNVSLEYMPYSWAKPLHVAAGNGRIDAVRILLAAGADPNARCSLGRTPLRWLVATCPERGHRECALLLLDHGADPEICDREGNTVLYQACSNGGVENAGGGGEGFEIAELLIRHGANVNAAGRRGETPLHGLAGRGRETTGYEKLRLEVARMLLEHGASLRVKDRSGQTPMDLARKSQYVDMVDLFDKWQVGDKKGSGGTKKEEQGGTHNRH